jgi:hypothetical protein
MTRDTIVVYMIGDNLTDDIGHDMPDNLRF